MAIKPANATLDHIVNVEFATHPPHVNVLAPKLKRHVAGAHG
jgi:hypothetical protein